MKKILPITATALIAASLGTNALSDETFQKPEAAADITGSISQSTAEEVTAPAIEGVNFDEAIAAHILQALGAPPCR